MSKVTTNASPGEVDLNRWAIEMAMRWPVISSGGIGGAGLYQGGLPPCMTDADVIGRAVKIITWIKQKN